MSIAFVLSAVLNSIGWMASVFALAFLFEIAAGDQWKQRISRASQRAILNILESNLPSFPRALIPYLFGARHFSWKSVWRCSVASIIFMIMILAFFQWKFRPVNKELWALLRSYDLKTASYALLFFATALATDYLSIGKSRIFARFIFTRSSFRFLAGAALLAADLSISALISIVIFSLMSGIISAVDAIPGAPAILPDSKIVALLFSANSLAASVSIIDGQSVACLSRTGNFVVGLLNQFELGVDFLINIFTYGYDGKYTVVFPRIPIAIPSMETGHHRWVDGMIINDVTFPFGHYFYSAFLVPTISLTTLIAIFVANIWARCVRKIGLLLANTAFGGVLREHPFWILWGSGCLLFGMVFCATQLCSVSQ